MNQYPNHVLQSILVPKSRKDVRGSADRARVVAERHGARPGGKVAEQENYFAFRQVDPDRIEPGSYISFKIPNSGVVLRKGLPKSRLPKSRLSRSHARENPSGKSGGDGDYIWYAAGGAAVVLIGSFLLSARTASASTSPNPLPSTPTPTPPTPTTPRPTPPHLTPLPTIVRQSPLTPNSQYAAAAIRVLQAQLHDLGYTITHIDGVYGPETSAAVASFLLDAGLSLDTSGLETMIAVDNRYEHVFDSSSALT